MAQLSAGTAAGHLLVGLSLPVLTRLFNPEQFGTYAVYTSALSLVLVITSFRYELAIPLASDDEDAFSLLALSIGIVIVMAILLGAGGWLFRSRIAGWARISSEGTVAVLIPIAVFVAGTHQALTYWWVRSVRFRKLAGSRISQRSSQVCTQIGFGLERITSSGLIVGDVVGRAVASGVLAREVVGRDRHRLSWARVRGMAKRYRRFPQFATGSALANTATTQLPFVLLAVLYSRRVTGTYAVAEAIVAVPVTVVAAAVAQVYMREAAIRWRMGRAHLRAFYILSAKRLALAGLVPALGFVVGARVILPAVLGPNWTVAAQYAQVMALAYFGNFMFQPLSQTLFVMERQSLQLACDSATLVITTLAIVLAKQFGLGGYGAVVAYSITMCLLCFLYLTIPLLALASASLADRAPDSETLNLHPSDASTPINQ